MQPIQLCHLHQQENSEHSNALLAGMNMCATSRCYVAMLSKGYDRNSPLGVGLYTLFILWEGMHADIITLWVAHRVQTVAGVATQLQTGGGKGEFLGVSLSQQ